MVGDRSSGLPTCRSACSVGCSSRRAIIPRGELLDPCFRTCWSASCWRTFWPNGWNKLLDIFDSSLNPFADMSRYMSRFEAYQSPLWGARQKGTYW